MAKKVRASNAKSKALAGNVVSLGAGGGRPDARPLDALGAEAKETADRLCAAVLEQPWVRAGFGPEVRLACEYFQWLAEVVPVLGRPDLASEQREALIADLGRACRGFASGGKPIDAVFAALEQASHDLPGFVSLDPRQIMARVQLVMEILRHALPIADVRKIDQTWLGDAICRWQDEKPAAEQSPFESLAREISREHDKRLGAAQPTKFESLSRAIAKTSFPQKPGSLKTAFADKKTGRKKPSGGRRRSAK